MSDLLTIVWLWHTHGPCPTPDQYGCEGHSLLVTPAQRAELEKTGWRMPREGPVKFR
jgi:hypothetical protein